MQEVVAFQGLGKRDWNALFQIPEINIAIEWGQEILASNDIGVEGQSLNLAKACREGGLVLQEHTQTCWQQPCIFLASMVYWKMWRERNPAVKPLLLGLSFGEYAAATAAGCVDEETGLLISAVRGILTSQAGGSALLVTARNDMLPVKRLRIRCKRIGGVWLSSINSPTQGLVSGNSLQVSEMEAYLKEYYPHLRVRPFPIGGAFHTPLMKKAKERLAKWMAQERIEWKEPQLPLLLNATREITKDPQRIQSMLLRQLSARLNFKSVAQKLPQDACVHEICVGTPVITQLIQQTHEAMYKKGNVRLAAHPFPA